MRVGQKHHDTVAGFFTSKNSIYSGILAFIAVSFVVAKWPTLAPRFSDGNMYIYMGWLIAHGSVPYRDFYYSSPPLIPYFHALVGSLIGFNWFVGALQPLVFTIFSVIMMVSLPSGPRARQISTRAVALFLMSFCVWSTTDFASDAHPITAFLLAAIVLATRGYIFFAGMVFGLGTLTKLYGVIGFIGILCAWILQKRWRDSLVGSAGFALVFGGVVLGFSVWIGPIFIQQTLWNNLGRPEGIEKTAILKFALAHDLWIIPASALFLYANIFRKLRVRSKPDILPLVAVFLCYCAFYVLYADIYYLYLLPAIALLVLLTALNSEAICTSKWRWFIACGLLVSGGYSIFHYWRSQAKAAVIDHLDDIVSRVRELTVKGQPIYGDYEITPLVALGSDRPIAAQLVDTNIKFFNMGIFNWDQRVAEIQQAGTQVILTKALIEPNGAIRSGPDRVLPINFFNKNCQVDSIWPIKSDYSSNAVIIWNCGLSERQG